MDDNERYVAIITVIVPLESTDEDAAQAEAEEYAEGLAQPPNDPTMISDVDISGMSAHLRKFFQVTT